MTGESWTHSVEVGLLEGSKLCRQAVTVTGSRDRRWALATAAEHVRLRSDDLDATVVYTHHKWARRADKTRQVS